MGSNLDIGQFIVFLWISFNDSLPSQFCSPPRGDYSGSIRFDIRDPADTGIGKNILFIDAGRGKFRNNTSLISCLKPVFGTHRKRDTDTTLPNGNGMSPVCRYSYHRSGDGCVRGIIDEEIGSTPWHNTGHCFHTPRPGARKFRYHPSLNQLSRCFFSPRV